MYRLYVVYRYINQHGKTKLNELLTSFWWTVLSNYRCNVLHKASFCWHISDSQECCRILIWLLVWYKYKIKIQVWLNDNVTQIFIHILCVRALFYANFQHVGKIKSCEDNGYFQSCLVLYNNNKSKNKRKRYRQKW